MRRFGLIGQTLTHSFSGKYFSEKFAREGITDAVYELYPLGSIAQFPELAASHPDLLGLNVTIPYKEAILPFLDELEETAKEIGAVNTIRFSGGKSQGFNTDVYGFRQSIKPFLTSRHERALLLGTGGASKAVHHVLRNIGIDCAFVTRNKQNAPKDTLLFNYDELNHYVMDAFKLIVNCTPLGTFPDIHSFPPIPYEHLGPDHLLYDLVYNPAETQFLLRGKQYHAQTMNGFDMLRLQAEKSWQIWNE